MSKNFLLFIILAVVVLGSFGVGGFADASLKEAITGNLDLSSGGLPEYESLMPVISLVIKGVLGLVVLIFFIMIIIAGIKWMTAGGNEETVAKAKKNISNAVIGVVVVMFSYAITVLIFDIILGKN